jgi:hypothetical protein
MIILTRNYISLGLLTLLLSGCLTNSKLLHKPVVSHTEVDTLHKLLEFSGDFAQKRPKERVTLCSSLFKNEPLEDKLLQQLKLSYAIAITPGCGSTSEALTLLRSSKKMAHTEQMTGVINYQLLLLKRLRSVGRYALDLKSKATALELKLEAIKSIEKALNRRD